MNFYNFHRMRLCRTKFPFFSVLFKIFQDLEKCTWLTLAVSVILTKIYIVSWNSDDRHINRIRLLCFSTVKLQITFSRIEHKTNDDCQIRLVSCYPMPFPRHTKYPLSSSWRAWVLVVFTRDLTCTCLNTITCMLCKIKDTLWVVAVYYWPITMAVAMPNVCEFGMGSIYIFCKAKLNIFCAIGAPDCDFEFSSFIKGLLTRDSQYILQQADSGYSRKKLRCNFYRRPREFSAKSEKLGLTEVNQILKYSTVIFINCQCYENLERVFSHSDKPKVYRIPKNTSITPSKQKTSMAKPWIPVNPLEK